MAFVPRASVNVGELAVEALRLRLIRRKGVLISDDSIKKIVTAINERTSQIRVEPVCKLQRCKSEQSKYCATCESVVVTPSQENGFSIEVSADFGGFGGKLKLSLNFTPAIGGHSIFNSGCPDSKDCESDFAYNIVVEVVLKGELTLEAGLVGSAAARPTKKTRVSRGNDAGTVSGEADDFDLSAVGTPVPRTGDQEAAASRAKWGAAKWGATVSITKSFSYVVDRVECPKPVQPARKTA